MVSVAVKDVAAQAVNISPSHFKGEKVRWMMLVLVLAANGLAHSFFFITFPALGRTMGMQDTQTGLVLGLSALFMTLAAPIWGASSERIGRRPIIITSLVSAFVLTVLTAVAIKFRLEMAIEVGTVFALLLTLRIVNSVAIAGFKPSVQAYIADITLHSQRIKGMGVLGASFGVGTILGGFMAVVFGQNSILIGFAVVTGIVFFVAIAAVFCLPESFAQEPEVELKKIATTFAAKIPFQKVWPLLIITVLGLFAYSTVQQVTALRLQDDFGISSDQSIRMTGGTMMITMLLMIVMQGFVVRLMQWTPSKLLVVGASVACVAMTAATFAPTFFTLLATTGLLGIGLGLLLPGNLAAMSIATGTKAQGKVAGVNAVSQGLGLAAGPVFSSALHQIAPTVPYAVASAVCVAMLILAVYFRRVETKSI